MGGADECVNGEDRAEGNGTSRVRFTVSLGGRQINTPVSVDVVTDRIPLGKPTYRRLEPAVPLDWPTGYPVALYPVTDHVADKVCAMYEMHGADAGRCSNFPTHSPSRVRIGQPATVPVRKMSSG